ncbi:hypothetical protein [Aquirufa nivalisilvae]
MVCNGEKVKRGNGASDFTLIFALFNFFKKIEDRLFYVKYKLIKLEKMKENASQVEAKEIWVKPKLEVVSVKESTLFGGGVTDDGISFS